MAVVVTNDVQPYHLVVKRGAKTTGIQSVLFTEWLMADDYDIIFPCHIKEPCFVITIADDGSKILQTLPRDAWASEFTKPVEKVTKPVGR